MPRCIACDSEMIQSSEIIRGYCDGCQVEVRRVFDKDAHALGHTTTPSGECNGGLNNISWTNYLFDEEEL